MAWKLSWPDTVQSLSELQASWKWFWCSDEKEQRKGWKQKQRKKHKGVEGDGSSRLSFHLSGVLDIFGLTVREWHRQHLATVLCAHVAHLQEERTEERANKGVNIRENPGWGGGSTRVKQKEKCGWLILLLCNLHKTFITTNLGWEPWAGPLGNPSINHPNLPPRMLNYSTQLLIKICHPVPNTQHDWRLDLGPQTNLSQKSKKRGRGGRRGGGGEWGERRKDRDSTRGQKRNVFAETERIRVGDVLIWFIYIFWS